MAVRRAPLAGVLQQLLRYLRRLDALDVCSSMALSQTLGPLLLQPQRVLPDAEPQELIDSAIFITELLIGWVGGASVSRAIVSARGWVQNTGCGLQETGL